METLDVEAPQALVPIETGVFVAQPDGHMDIAVKAHDIHPLPKVTACEQPHLVAGSSVYTQPAQEPGRPSAMQPLRIPYAVGGPLGCYVTTDEQPGMVVT
ncbi:hypothetical protein WJX72_006197 [[Myrmecia] bisecta]|uniref:Uncharacterized protein n=1 Tax=[Myrmecia] bisecta TaxID=41462 RepID=A0AAW1P8F7_9CHLO